MATEETATAEAADAVAESHPPVAAVETSTSDDTECATVMSGFSDIVASLHSSITSSDDTATANPTTSGGASSIASVVGKLKLMDKAVIALKAPPTLQSIELMSDMAELARASLPEDTRKALDTAGSGSDVAMELVRRNLTQLPTLAKALYKVTSDALEADDGLCTLHAELSSGLELYGALVVHGVDPRKRPWAQMLTEQFSSLTELRWLSWRRLMHTVGMGVVVGIGETADDEGGDDDEEETPKTEEEQKAAESAAAAKKVRVAQAERAAAIASAVPAIDAPSALARGEVRLLELLYSTGTNVPPIRKQALDFGLGLDAAGQLEDANIASSSKLTESSISRFQSKLKIPGKTESNIKSALMAMLSNKTAAPAVDEEDEDQFFGSYDTNEELVAAAGGGMALYGINFFPNENDVTLKPYAPILKKPTFVEMAGASASFEASVMHSTEQSMASNFTKTTENGGISIAQASTTSWGVSASVSSFGGVATAGVSADSSDAKEEAINSTSNNAFSANNKKKTTSATTVEAITCPMKSFRIPVSTMTMSEEALDSALAVDTLLKASQFLDTFGSHVSNGRHLLGGIFFRTMTLTSESEVDTSTLLSAASTQMQETRAEATSGEISASAGHGVMAGSASASMGSATSSGVVTFHSTAGKSENETADSRAMFQTFVRSMGPNVATPELFAKALFTDTSSWTVIDRGPFEALLPITDVLDNMLCHFDPSSAGKTQLENAINLLTVAWQQRASVWKHMEDDPAVPVSLRNMIGRSFATEDAHDQIRAAVVDLFEVLELEIEANTELAAEALSTAVLATAKEMEHKPAGCADFFEALKVHMASLPTHSSGRFRLRENTNEYAAAARSAKKLSSSDWVGFDLIWNKRMGNLALKKALDNHRIFEKATLRFGEEVTVDEPLISVDGMYRLEIFGSTLRVVQTEKYLVVETLFEAEGTLGNRACAHIATSGAFVLDLTMTTGFDQAETTMVLWTAPGTEGQKGTYARMQNDGKVAVFSSKGKQLWST